MRQIVVQWWNFSSELRFLIVELIVHSLSILKVSREFHNLFKYVTDTKVYLATLKSTRSNFINDLFN